nr:hypothetical protein 1634Bnrm1_p128 [Cryptomonas sp.]
MNKCHLYLNINHFLATKTKIKCYFKKKNFRLKLKIQNKCLNKYQFNIKNFPKLFPLWLSEILSKNSICRVTIPSVYNKFSLKKILFDPYNIGLVSASFNFYSIGLQLGKTLNQTILCHILRDIFIQRYIELLRQYCFDKKKILKENIVKLRIKDFEKTLYSSMQYTFFKF